MLFGIVSISTIFSFLFILKCYFDYKNIYEKDSCFTIKKNQFLIALVVILIFNSLVYLLFHFYGYGPIKILKYCILIWGLLPIGIMDLKKLIIPNRWLMYLIIVRVVIYIAECVFYPSVCISILVFSLQGFILMGILMFITYVISRHQIGFGDIKLLMVIGLYIGLTTNVIMLLISLIISAFYIGIKILRKKITTKDYIPLAPFIFWGMMITLLIGF